MALPFLRSLPLLLLLLPTSLREYYLPTATNNDAVVGEEPRHPIVLVPGASCSELEARLTDAYQPSKPQCGAIKGKGWFELWKNCSDLPARHYVPCFMEQMRLVYNSTANEYGNFPGVEIRVPNFGSFTGFLRHPEHPDWCLHALRHELLPLGYRDGDALFGAPYDFRHAPPIPGQPSQVYAEYFRQLTTLVEDACRKQQGRKAILFGHSFGGTVVLEFARAAPPAWRDRYIKRLVLVGPLPAAGFVQSIKNFASGSVVPYIPKTTPLSLRPMWRTLEAAIAAFPSPAVFGDDTPLVVTRRRNYTARDMADLLADVGATDAVEPFRRRSIPRMSCFEAPMVPVTCINGVGADTREQLMYWDGDFDKDPQVLYGDGDETINLASMLAFDEEMRRQPGQREQYKSIKLPGATHSDIVTQEWSLKLIIQEMLE